MEKREQEKLRVQTEAIHVLEADEGTSEHETHGKWHDRFLPKNMMKQVSQWANKRRKWEAGETFGDASWNAHTAALCTSATSVVNVEETMNVFAYLDKNRGWKGGRRGAAAGRRVALRPTVAPFY